MKLIRRYVKMSDDNFRCCIWADNYAHTFKHIQELVAQARADFPAYSLEDFDIKVYGGNRHKGQMVVEFTLPANATMPENYENGYQLEYTLN